MQILCLQSTFLVLKYFSNVQIRRFQVNPTDPSFITEVPMELEKDKENPSSSESAANVEKSVSNKTDPASANTKKSKKKTFRDKWKDLVRERRSCPLRLHIL